MRYSKKSLTNVSAAMFAGVTFIAIAVWQFYLFIIFRNAQGTMSMRGGTHHLWLAIGAALIACIAGFYVFSVFHRDDKVDDLRINS
jgi:heme/copper-type cytochrome/quinol oxidase subunit 2